MEGEWRGDRMKTTKILSTFRLAVMENNNFSYLSDFLLLIAKLT